MMIKKIIQDNISKIMGYDFEEEYLKINNLNNINELKKLLTHAYKNVPYYNRIFREICKTPDEVDIPIFNKIPILTKEIIRNQQKELISTEFTKRKWYYNSSGGSTGEPIKFIQDNLYRRWRNATNKYYYKNILGIDEEIVRKIIIWGSERDLFEGSIGLKAKINNWLTNTIFLNSFRMGEEDINYYIRIINTYKPDLIRGYAGSLFELCRYAERKNLIIHTPKILISAAETLEDEMRDKIEAVFGTKLYNSYGSREVSYIAGECKKGLMHVFTFWNHVELLDKNNQPLKKDKEGKVIVTNLHNYSMPFIRYNIGDFAIIGPKRCKCGNILPTLKKVTGRITDHFIKRDGTIIPAEFFIHLIGVVYNRDSIKKFQVIQEEYNKLKILVVPDKFLTKKEREYIENKIKTLMGNDCKIDWKMVEEIPITKSGKYFYTKSLVWR